MLTAYEVICETWAIEPKERFSFDPIYQNAVTTHLVRSGRNRRFLRPPSRPESNVWVNGHTTASKQSVKTRETVQLAGVEQTGSGNMRKGFEFLNVTPYSDCIKLGKQVQSWARDVFDVAEKAVTAARLKD